jgi:hypothetical protein
MSTCAIGFGLKITKARCHTRRAIGRSDKIVLLKMPGGT